MFSLYLFGILYGDGFFLEKNNKPTYIFSTTHKELIELVKKNLSEQHFIFIAYTRTQTDEEKENWGDLEIMESSDPDFISLLEEQGFFSAESKTRIKNNRHFIRGYFETKGTLFSYSNKNILYWRASISGKKDDLETLTQYLKNIIGKKRIFQRKEREELGINSVSYRFSINKREELADFLNFIYNNVEISLRLETKMNDFFSYYESEPFNMKRVFKHYKYAAQYMAKELNLLIKGIRGGGYGSKKPVYLWENGEAVKKFEGWEGVYYWICPLFENKTGKKAPEVS